MDIVDCIIGGSPCQDLSVAGKRAGLDGERSGLFMEQLRIVKEMRDKDARTRGIRADESIRPRFMVWENVPGAFSSNKGEDFRIVLEEIAKVIDKDAVIPMPPKNKWTTSGCIMGDGWSIAWRVHDAQFWGVPQRRRRIALVADFGGGCAPEVLFERKGLRGDSEESRTKRQGASTDAQGCTHIHDRDGEERAETVALPVAYSTTDVYEWHNQDSRITGPINVACTLNTNAGGREGHLVLTKCYDIGDRRNVANESVDVAPTLLSKMGTGGNNVPIIMEGLDCYNQQMTGDKATCLRSKSADTDHIPCVVMDRSAYKQGENAKFNIGIDEDGVAFSHIAKGPGAVCYVEEEPVICLQGNQVDRADTSVCNGSGWKEDTSYTLNTMDRHAVCYKKPHYIVRRLTPLECERLQGFPDGWTDIGEYIDSKGKKKKTSDSARYKALGNSIALPSWKWVIKRICSHYERDATMASLFDGIGGFPHLWEQINGKGTALWASEIEDFPIAVTKERIR